MTLRNAVVLSLGLIPALASAASAGERIAVGVRDGGGSTSTIYQLDLADGSATGFEVRSSGTRLDSINVNQNLFQAIGRPTTQAAPRGSVFLLSLTRSGGTTEALALLEADTGYLGFLNRVGKDRKVGTVLGAVGRPGIDAAASDGLHAVVPVTASNGSLAGLYLVHGATGACVYISDLEAERGQASGAPCSALPPSTGGLATAPLRGEAPGFVLLEATSGDAWLVRSTSAATTLIATPLQLDLAGHFGPGAGETPVRRYSMSEVWSADGNAVLIADATSNRLAYVTGLESGAPRLVPVPVSPPRSTGVDDPRAVLVPVYSGESTTRGVLAFAAGGTAAILVTGFDESTPRAVTVEIRR